MATLTCPDCDSPGDGNCSVCHGKGKIPADEMPGGLGELLQESTCSACSGSGHCQTCCGTGEIEIGGESE